MSTLLSNIATPSNAVDLFFSTQKCRTSRALRHSIRRHAKTLKKIGLHERAKEWLAGIRDW